MKVTAIMTNGTEEIECLAVVDILRRAGIDVELVSADGVDVIGSHGIKITADSDIGGADINNSDLLFIPGGLPGTTRLAECAPLIAAIKTTLERGKRVAAICAAPALVLCAHGFLQGVTATCNPSFTDRMVGCKLSTARVVTDGLITTAQGMSCACELGVELVRLLAGEERAEQVKRSIVL